MNLMQKNISKVAQQRFHTVETESNFLYGILGGSIVAIICAIIWAAITVGTEYQIGWMAIGVGFAVGISVRMFGRGKTISYSVAGSVLALLGCIAGNIFSTIGFIAKYQAINVFQALYLIDPDYLMDAFLEDFQLIDFLFYGLAIYEGFRFSILPDNRENQGETAFVRYRLPVIATAAVLIVVGVYNLKFLASGMVTYHYDSGEKMSQGFLKDGKNQGEWTYWHENGEIKSVQTYDQGLMDGKCTWWDNKGGMIETGFYEKGLAEGKWVFFHDDRSKSAEGEYTDDRRHGKWVFWYKNQRMREEGNYNRDRLVGKWQYWYNNGTLMAVGNYDNNMKKGIWEYWYANANKAAEIDYQNNIELIKNCWASDGKHWVVNGNGEYIAFHENGNKQTAGQVVNSKKTGIWKIWDAEGNLTEECLYKDGLYTMFNIWAKDGKQLLKDGNGHYVEYYEKQVIKVEGNVKDGLKEGEWNYYYDSGTKSTSETFKSGIAHGTVMKWYPSGQLSYKGNYQNGKLEGECVWYHQNGKLLSKTILKADKKIGKQSFWDADGNHLRDEYYDNGLYTKTILAAQT